MANIKSSIKRVQIGERNRLRNKSYRSMVKTYTKKVFEALEAYTAAPNADQLATVQQLVSITYSKIDKAVKRGILHTNTGARKKARLAKAVKAATMAQAAS